MHVRGDDPGNYGYASRTFISFSYVLICIVLGAMDTATTCGAQVPGWVLIHPSRVALFSLLTNTVATTLIAYRAWCVAGVHFGELRNQLSIRVPSTRVGSTVASSCRT